MQWLGKKIRQDNYSWVLYNAQREAIILDCGDFKAVKDFLQAEKLKLKYILLTHYHSDHLDGVQELQEFTQAKVIGNKNFIERLPKLDITVSDLDELTLLQEKIIVYAMPGHCDDHIVYYLPNLKLLFIGDVLFSLGCGKVFEGEDSVMVDSLNKIKQFPQDTLIFPSHEYTKANLTFVEHLGFVHLDKEREAIINQDCTLPSKLSFEMKFNPFLNLNNPDFKKQVTGSSTIDDVEFFTKLRALKNNFTHLVGG